MSYSRLLSYTLVATSLFSATVSFAEHHNTPHEHEMAATAEHDGGKHAMHHREHKMGMMHVLKQLHSLPKLTGAQHTEVDALITQAQEHHKKAEAQHENMGTGSALDKINQHIEWQENHLKQAKAFQQDFKHFYEGLNAEQKAKADEAFNHNKHDRKQLARPVSMHPAAPTAKATAQ